LRIEVRDQERVAQERLGIHLCEGGSALEDTLDRLARVDVRHHAEHRDLQVGFDVLDGADRGVERLLHEGEDQAERKAEQRANQDGVEGLGPARRAAICAATSRRISTRTSRKRSSSAWRRGCLSVTSIARLLRSRRSSEYMVWSFCIAGFVESTKTRSDAFAGSVRARRAWTSSSSVRCWRAFSMSLRAWVNRESSTVDSAPGEMTRLASRNAHTSDSARLTRASTSLSWVSMNLRASVTRRFRCCRL